MQKWNRAGHAAKIVRDELERKLKGKVKLDRKVNEKIWSKGGEKAVSKLRLRIVELDDKSYRAELVA